MLLCGRTRRLHAECGKGERKVSKYTIGFVVSEGLVPGAELWDGVVFWRIEKDGKLLALVDNENFGRRGAEEIVAALQNADTSRENNLHCDVRGAVDA